MPLRRSSMCTAAKSAGTTAVSAELRPSSRVHFGHRLPVQPGGTGQAEVLGNDALGDTKAAGDGLVGEPAAVLESKNVLDHAYVHSLLRHRLSGQKAVRLCPSGGSHATPAPTA